METWNEQTHVTVSTRHFQRDRVPVTMQGLAPQRKLRYQSHLRKHLCGHPFCFFTVLFLHLIDCTLLCTGKKSTSLCAISKVPMPVNHFFFVQCSSCLSSMQQAVKLCIWTKLKFELLYLLRSLRLKDLPDTK